MHRDISDMCCGWMYWILLLGNLQISITHAWYPIPSKISYGGVYCDYYLYISYYRYGLNNVRVPLCFDEWSICSIRFLSQYKHHLSRRGDSHYDDKVVMRLPYLIMRIHSLVWRYHHVETVPKAWLVKWVCQTSRHIVEYLNIFGRWFLAATKQLYKWYFPSVRPSVRPSVCHTFFTMFPSLYHHEIFRSYYHGQKLCPCKRSRSEVKGQGHRGQHPT